MPWRTQTQNQATHEDPDGMNNGGRTRLGQNDVCGTMASVSGTLDGDTDVGMG